MSTKREQRKNEENSRADFAVTMRLLRLHRTEAEQRKKSYAGWSVGDFEPDLSIPPHHSRTDHASEEEPWMP